MFSHKTQKLLNLLIPIIGTAGVYFAVGYFGLIPTLIVSALLLYFYAKSNYDVGRVEGFLEGQQEINSRWFKGFANSLSMIPDMKVLDSGKDLDKLKKEFKNAQR